MENEAGAWDCRAGSLAAFPLSLVAQTNPVAYLTPSPLPPAAGVSFNDYGVGPQGPVMQPTNPIGCLAVSTLPPLAAAPFNDFGVGPQIPVKQLINAIGYLTVSPLPPSAGVQVNGYGVGPYVPETPPNYPLWCSTVLARPQMAHVPSIEYGVSPCVPVTLPISPVVALASCVLAQSISVVRAFKVLIIRVVQAAFVRNPAQSAAAKLAVHQSAFVAVYIRRLKAAAPCWIRPFPPFACAVPQRK